MIFVLVLLVTIPFFICAVNAVLNRRPESNPHVTPFTAGKHTAGVFLPVYLITHIAAFGFDPIQLICGFIFISVYINCMLFLNWFIFTLTDVSMHIQLLLRLHAKDKVSVENITEQYNKNIILNNRVPRLIALGQLRLENGRLFISGKSVLSGAFACQLTRKILGIPAHPELADHKTDKLTFTRNGKA